MADRAVSDDPAVQRQLDRLATLSPGDDTLGLERITALLDRLGRPQDDLPPVFHVAGTNGKGSVCAYLRAAIEAAGHAVHVYTSPHLVRFNERIRVADRLIDDAALAALLEEVLDAADGIAPSFFEATTAAAFLAFARTPAAATILEVGLGGRLDATNMVARPAVTGIVQLAIDHQQFLGDTIEQIATEKAGIARAGVPLVTLHYPASVADRIGQAANAAGADWLPQDSAWTASVLRRRLAYSDVHGELDLPLPRLAGRHQAINAGLAVAMLRHQRALDVPVSAIRAGLGWAEWPARLQRLTAGPLPALLPPGAALWLDGGHNPAAAAAIARFFSGRPRGGRMVLVLGMLANKDPPGFLAPFRGSGALVQGVPVPGHAHHPPAAIKAAAERIGLTGAVADDPIAALETIARDGIAAPTVLIGGSLYLAGTILAANGTPPL